ncbi:hypothetical protein OF117_15285 [Geodermatophilus sp. YIM 151500]|uniref:hypothetical protein n=1 Tax=Geodermatophilus sp. YIM 151500 TaxID=2984531 RepID=UPI0021E402EB|nr:hypothetical protein [Geodermatophilus sp. YIM 151500]MCV2490722.1 hypothetical protein [Geodermatophilus sp. YIM 151500]
MVAGGADRVELLWTGGWDSTFRLLQLLLVERRAVQPIYVVDPGRRSTRHELRAMAAIRAGALPRLAGPTLLAPSRVVLAGDYPPSPADVALGQAIRGRGVKLGDQYVWLAGPAAALGWSGVELAVPGEAEPAPWETVVFDEPGRLGRNPEAGLFRFWSFPLIGVTKEEMREIARDHGFLDLLLLRWSCHDPVGDRPCGRCHPCGLALPDGLHLAPRSVVQARATGRSLRRSVARARVALRDPTPVGA